MFFKAYGALAGAISTFLMYLLLLPINSWRLIQMRNLVKKARVAAQGDLSMDWLKPFMNRRNYRRGDVLFRKGQLANEMFLPVTGKFLVTEIGVEIPAGRLMGELGFLTPNNTRTQSVECTENGEVLTITYDRLLEIYFRTLSSAITFSVSRANACCRTLLVLKEPLRSTRSGCKLLPQQARNKIGSSPDLARTA